MKISSLIFLAVTNIYGNGQKDLAATFPYFSVPVVMQNDSIPNLLQNEATFITSDFEINYNLEAPDQTFELPETLNEISGLSFDKNHEKLFAVQDEDGIIFIIDKISGEVEKEVEFYKEGDYEGIEVAGDVVYVVKNTGTIYEVTNLGQEDQKMEKYNLFLSAENDVEGLCFDPATNKLLLACKGLPATGESFEIIRYKKVVYGFDVTTKEVDPVPVYTIQLDGIQKCLLTNTKIEDTEQLTDLFSSEKEDLDFNPSAIAIHPITNDVYVISSSGKTLIVLNSAGEVVYIERLNKEIHAQPEGMAFDADGTLYISNEAKDETAKIHRFKYKQ